MSGLWSVDVETKLEERENMVKIIKAVFIEELMQSESSTGQRKSFAKLVSKKNESILKKD